LRRKRGGREGIRQKKSHWDRQGVRGSGKGVGEKEKEGMCEKRGKRLVLRQELASGSDVGRGTGSTKTP